MTQPTIVDSHCHLDFPDFEGEIPNLVSRAEEAGVKRMVTICTRLKNEPKVRKIAEEFNSIYYACLLYTSPSPRDQRGSRMPSSA